jgi:amino-acid N-acetyltransferase
MPHRLYVRIAEVGDISAMLQLMQPYMDDGTLLQRDEDDLCQHVQEFMVAYYDGQLAGLAALHVYTRTLAEIRSLVVTKALRHLGVGALLIEGCERMATDLGIEQVFALTYVDGFFHRLGYRTVAKESLPHKIWTVCIHCPKFSHCDEIAVKKTLHIPADHGDHVAHILDRYQP